MDAFRRFAFAVSVALLAVAPAYAQTADNCGQPLSTGETPKASDALFVLRASVGTEECSLCVCDVNASGSVTATDALITLQAAVGLDVSLDCPDDCAPDASLECPAVAQFALFANVRPAACSTNAECAPFSTCDPELGRCRTQSENDIGWNGLAHDQDLNDHIPARLFVDCEGPAPCGECEITGHDPSLGSCRCANDNQTRCFTVAAPDQENCGGEMCNCYFGPPLPLSAGNTPVCVLNKIGVNPTGTGNVDTGSGTINMHLREVVHLGISLSAPCPICANDPTPADGMRGGVCVGGLNNTQGCDAQAVNTSFPPPTGAFYSLDCFPLPNADISNGGLHLDFQLTTGAQSLTASLPCGEGELAELDCHCRVCSGDSQLGCSSDAQCAAEGAGTCTSNGGGEQPFPNACSDGVCVDSGDNEGLCATGPDDTWCDAVVRADGSGLIGCGSNIDCDVTSIGIEGGACTLVERRSCFLPTITTQGDPDPNFPLAAGIYCSPPTAASSVNTAAGLPGPGRLTLQSLLTLYCKSDITETYTPGVGGCPEVGTE
jgi:hypothetical protein